MHRAFDKVAIDIMGPRPATSSGYSYILTMQDLLTKYSIAAPLRDVTSTTIADQILKRLICIFGAPKAILTDQGSNLISSIIKYLAKRFKIKRYITLAYRPQSNGSLERSHHVLAEYLKVQTDKGKEWDTWLDLAILSYNTSVHEGTNYTPHELVFGKTARIPNSEPEIDNQEITTYTQYLNLNTWNFKRNPGERPTEPDSCQT